MIWGSVIVGLSIAMLMPTNLLIGQYTTLAVAAYTLFGLGLAFYATPSTDAALSNLPDDQAGSGSGIHKMASSLGASFGVAISAAIFTALSAKSDSTHWLDGVITFCGSSGQSSRSPSSDDRVGVQSNAPTVTNSAVVWRHVARHDRLQRHHERRPGYHWVDAETPALIRGCPCRSTQSPNCPRLHHRAVAKIQFPKLDHAGNVIAQSAILRLSIRTTTPEDRTLVLAKVQSITKAQAESFGCTSEIREGVPGAVLVNDPVETAKAADTARKAFGDEAVVYPGPSYLGSEDFAFMLQKKQGTYCLLGNGDTAMVHHPRYVFNDDILPMGAAYWVTLTEQYLREA